MTLKDFDKKFQDIADKVPDFIQNIAPRIAGQVALDHAKENFQRQSFDGRPWQEVQRRIPGSKTYRANARRHPARLSRPILTGDTGDLGRSINVSYSKGQVTVFSDKIYAKVHNEGLRAGRGNGFIMPQRQFLGPSEALEQDIKQQILQQFQNLFK